MSDPRKALMDSLRSTGYEIVESGSDISDPFHWWVVARKDEYEIRCEERALALVSDRL